MRSDRDEWTAFAKSSGLLGPETPRPAAPPEEPKHKYGARRVEINGIWFDSTKEATRYTQLKMQELAGAIVDLELQPVFPLHVVELYRQLPPIAVTCVGVYRADFRYVDTETGEIVIEDVKSEATKTEAYNLRRRIAEAVHGITVREV